MENREWELNALPHSWSAEACAPGALNRNRS